MQTDCRFCSYVRATLFVHPKWACVCVCALCNRKIQGVDDVHNVKGLYRDNRWMLSLAVVFAFSIYFIPVFFLIYQKRVQNAVHLSWLRINAKMRISFVYLLHAPMIWIRERHRDRERGKNCTRYLLIDHFCVDKTFAESIILLWLSHGTRCGQTIEWTEHWTRDKITLNFLLHIWLYSIFFPALCCFEERESVCVFWRS